MSSPADLRRLEAGAYRASWNDGIIDCFVGLSLLWIGTAWLLLPDLAGVAGVLPAVMAPALLPFRTRIIEGRSGYVRWREPRRRWERRNLVIVLAAGVLLFLLGIGALVAVERRAGEATMMEWIAPGLLAFLLALLTAGLALVIALPRLLVYAAVLAGAGIVAVWGELNPGWPILIAGTVIAAVGGALLVRFLRSHPVAPS